jgi:hypothetical protein
MPNPRRRTRIRNIPESDTAMRAWGSAERWGSARQRRKRLSSRPVGMNTQRMREDMLVTRFIRLAGLGLMTLALMACESQQERYLKKHVNHVSLDAVAKRFGPPHRAQALTTGETVWSYEFRERSDCTAYILRFDQAKVLRDWNERQC